MYSFWQQREIGMFIEIPIIILKVAVLVWMSGWLKQYVAVLSIISAIIIIIIIISAVQMFIYGVCLVVLSDLDY